MEIIKLDDIKNIKELSWYLTVPLFTSASVLENIQHAPMKGDTKFQYLFKWIIFIGEHFFSVSIGLIIFFLLYMLIAGRLEGVHNFPLTLILATVILSFATVGLMLHAFKLNGIDIPVNIVWFISFTALSFNLYQLNSNV